MTEISRPYGKLAEDDGNFPGRTESSQKLMEVLLNAQIVHTMHVGYVCENA